MVETVELLILYVKDVFKVAHSVAVGRLLECRTYIEATIGSKRYCRFAGTAVVHLVEQHPVSKQIQLRRPA